MTDQNILLQENGYPNAPDIKTLRMDAYYYGFESTGDYAVDLVLSAVACAGKANHHTMMWSEALTTTPPVNMAGKTPEDWIQNAANKAAAHIEQLERELAEARKDALRYRWLRETGLDASIDSAMSKEEL